MRRKQRARDDDRRRFHRRGVRWIARCHFDGLPYGVLCRVVDVSIRGAAILVPGAPLADEGHALSLRLYPGDTSDGFQVRGIVTYTRPAGPDTVVGIEFGNVDATQERLLELLIGLDSI